MSQIGYAMQFRGTVEQQEGKENELWVKTGSTTNSLTTALGAGGPTLAIDEAASERASFTSNVQMLEYGSFTKDGTIDFGEAGTLHLTTIGTGWMGPTPDDQLGHGAIIWRIDGGTGPLEGASGIITSNYTISGHAEVCDNQWGVIFVGD